MKRQGERRTFAILRGSTLISWNGPQALTGNSRRSRGDSAVSGLLVRKRRRTDLLPCAGDTPITAAMTPDGYSARVATATVSPGRGGQSRSGSRASLEPIVQSTTRLQIGTSIDRK